MRLLTQAAGLPGFSGRFTAFSQASRIGEEHCLNAGQAGTMIGAKGPSAEGTLLGRGGGMTTELQSEIDRIVADADRNDELLFVALATVELRSRRPRLGGSPRAVAEALIRTAGDRGVPAVLEVPIEAIQQLEARKTRSFWRFGEGLVRRAKLPGRGHRPRTALAQFVRRAEKAFHRSG